MTLSPHSLSVIKANLLALIFQIVPCYAFAENSGIQIHGALTQGLFYTDNNNFIGNSENNIGTQFTELNINLSTSLLSNLRFASQLLYRRAGEAQNDLAIDYAFIDYQFSSNFSSNYGIRLGRAKVPIGLHNETRDVAFTRPSIFLPQSIYPDTTRDTLLSADGVFVYGNIFTNQSQWSFETGYGSPRLDKDTLKKFSTLFGEEEPKNEKIFASRILYENHNGLRFGLSHTQGSSQYLVPVPYLGDVQANAELYQWLISAQYSVNNLTYTAEYLRFENSFKMNPVLNAIADGEAWYIQSDIQLTDDTSLYARWDVYYGNRNDRSGHEISNLSGDPSHRGFAKDIMIGWRHHYGRKTMLSMEYHYINGTAWISTFDNESLEDTQRYWNLISMQLSYRF